MTMTQTCYECEGTGKAKYDPTLADKVGLLDRHKACPVCEGRGVSGPKPERKAPKVNDQAWEPVPDDFWDSWGV